MHLIELFTYTTKVDWNNGHGFFSVDGNEYVIQLVKVTRVGEVHQAMPNLPLTDNTYFFSFASIDGGFPTDTRTDKHQAIKIFSVILNTLEEVVPKNNIDTLYFGGDTSDKKRLDLYQKIIDKYTKKHNWEVVETTKINVFNTEKYVWVVQKGK